LTLSLLTRLNAKPSGRIKLPRPKSRACKADAELSRDNSIGRVCSLLRKADIEKLAKVGCGSRLFHVGECADAKTGFRDHERWEEAVRNYRATHILTCSAPKGDAARKRIESDLILAHDPVMNVQYLRAASYAK
jgi:hypothetical protein